MNLSEEIVFRTATADDKDFVFSTWLKSYKYSSYFAQRIKKYYFFKYHQKVLDAIWERETSHCLIACLKEDESVILGYIVVERFEKPILHFIYVKSNFRNFGIAKSLIDESEIDLSLAFFTHWCFVKVLNDDGSYYFDNDWFFRKFPNLTYNPYLI